MSYLTEAFKQMELLESEQFTFDKETKETNNKSKKNKSEIQIEYIEPNLD